MTFNKIAKIAKCIQNCWLKLHKINKSQLMKKLGRNRSYDYFVFRSHNLHVLCSLMATEGHFLNEIDTSMIIIGIKRQDLKILMASLDAVSNRIAKKYTPLYAFVLKHNISINNLAQALHVSNVDVTSNLIRTRLQIQTIKRIANIYHLSSYHLAKMYGYQSSDIRQSNQRSLRKRSNQVGRYLKRLRKKNHLTQLQVARKLNTGQSEITAIENWRAPQMKILIRCARLYNISLHKLISLCPRYQSVERNSVYFRILEIRLHYHCTFADIASKACLKPGYVKSLVLAKQHTKVLNPHGLKGIISAFHLPRDYFKNCYISMFMKNFKEYKKRTTLNEADVGYRYNKVRCLHEMSYQDVAKKMDVTTSAAQELSNRHSVQSKTLNQISRIFPKEQNYLLNNNK